MGTAPGRNSQSALPPPDQFVTAGVTMLKDIGLDDQYALTVILSAATRLKEHARYAGVKDLIWLKAVIVLVAERLADLPPSDIDRME